jgi:hypothetical protein
MLDPKRVQARSAVAIGHFRVALWPLSNEGVAYRYFEEIEELEEALVERCLALLDQPDLIRYHWWPEVA